MKKLMLSAIISMALVAGGVSPASAGAAMAPPSSSSDSDVVAIAVILLIGAIIFGGNKGRSRNTKTVKPADSEF